MAPRYTGIRGAAPWRCASSTNVIWPSANSGESRTALASAVASGTVIKNFGTVSGPRFPRIRAAIEGGAMSDERWLAPLSVREEPPPDGQVPRAAPYRVSARPFSRNPARTADDTGRDGEMAPRFVRSAPHPGSLRFQPSQTDPSIAAVRRNPSSSPRSVSRGRFRTSTTARDSSGTSTRRYPSISPRATPPSSIATGTFRGPRRSSRSSNPCASPA